MLREELRIISARMRRVPANRRPQYTGLERMAILQLRAMRGWNKSETSRHFLVSDDTIRDWLRRVDDDALVQTSTPVNRFPDVVRYAVQQIKLFCPTLGKLKIAEKLARAGMPIVKLQRFGRGKRLESARRDRRRVEKGRAKSLRLSLIVHSPAILPRSGNGHTWNADLTAVPISGGFWTPWIPTAIAQRWPVCWWVLNVIDHFSRRAVGAARLQEPAHRRRGHGRVGSHHIRRADATQTFDCRSRL